MKATNRGCVIRPVYRSANPRQLYRSFEEGWRHMELRTFQSTVITRRLPKNAVMERGIFSAIKKIFRFCHFGFSMQNGDSEIVTELPKSSVVLFKVVIFRRCLLRLKKVMARVIFRASPTIDSAINTSTGGYHITLFQRVVLTIKRRQNKTYFKWRWLNTNNLSRV